MATKLTYPLKQAVIDDATADLNSALGLKK